MVSDILSSSHRTVKCSFFMISFNYSYYANEGACDIMIDGLALPVTELVRCMDTWVETTCKTGTSTLVKSGNNNKMTWFRFFFFTADSLRCYSRKKTDE